VDSLVKVGDYYYHGLGDPEEDEATRLEKAAKYYQSAAESQFSALAMWNLGWMYENGVGVPQVILIVHLSDIILLILVTCAGLPPCETAL
jgi:TPR repeat protein